MGLIWEYVNIVLGALTWSDQSNLTPFHLKIWRLILIQKRILKQLDLNIDNMEDFAFWGLHSEGALLTEETDPSADSQPSLAYQGNQTDPIFNISKRTIQYVLSFQWGKIHRCRLQSPHLGLRSREMTIDQTAFQYFFLRVTKVSRSLGLSMLNCSRKRQKAKWNKPARQEQLGEFETLKMWWMKDLLAGDWCERTAERGEKRNSSFSYTGNPFLSFLMCHMCAHIGSGLCCFKEKVGRSVSGGKYEYRITESSSSPKCLFSSREGNTILKTIFIL